MHIKLPLQELLSLILLDFGQCRLEFICRLHHEHRPRLIKAVIDLKKTPWWQQHWFWLRQRLVSFLHLPEGPQVVGHPDPLLASRLPVDALAVKADVLLSLHTGLQLLQKVADLHMLLLVDDRHNVGYQDKGIVCDIFSFVAMIADCV